LAGADVAVVLNVHRETDYIVKTLMSLAAAVERARRAGAKMEIVIVFDRSDAATIEATQAATQNFPCPVRSLRVDHGNLALARNDGIEASQGEFVMVMDADDLTSVNSIEAPLRALEQHPEASLAFPEFCVGFGDVNFALKLHGTEEVSTLAFIDSHPFISRVMFRREVVRDVKYVPTSPLSPYHYEDWHWNCECRASGFRFVVAKDAALYYRQRPGSIMHVSRKLGRLEIAPSRLFRPEIYCQTTERDYARWLAAEPAAFDRDALRAELRRLSEDVAVQSRFEPELKPDFFRSALLYDNRVTSSFAVGACYYEICKFLPRHGFDQVFLLPFHVYGGAELYIRTLMEACYEIAPETNVLAILGETTSALSSESELPANVTVVNLGRDWSHLSMDERCLIALKLIQSVAPKAIVHARQSAFSEAFLDAYRNLLGANALILYPFFLPRRYGPSLGRSEQIFSRYVDDNIDAATRLVTDNFHVIVEYTALRRMAEPNPKWRCLRAPHAMSMSVAELEAQHRRRRAAGARRALWASRIDAQKRPRLLGKIARVVAQRGLGCELDVYGSSMFLDEKVVEPLIRDVVYKGEFRRFGDLPAHQYSCFVYTAFEDGVPNVLLEAASHGLPIIAPDVGGISEFVEDGVTGLLLASSDDDDEMALRYASAIERLLDDPDLGLRLAISAADRIEKMFNAAAHREAVRDILFRGKAGTREGGMTSPNPAQAQSDANGVAPVDDAARQRALVEMLEARNSELRKTLQIERERFVTTKEIARHDGRVALANDEIYLDGRKMPVKLFRRLAKAWGRRGKRTFLRVAFWLVGARV